MDICKEELDAFLENVVQAENSFFQLDEMSLAEQPNLSNTDKSLKIIRVYYRHKVEKDASKNERKCLGDKHVEEIHRNVAEDISVAILLRKNTENS